MKNFYESINRHTLWDSPIWPMSASNKNPFSILAVCVVLIWFMSASKTNPLPFAWSSEPPFLGVVLIQSSLNDINTHVHNYQFTIISFQHKRVRESMRACGKGNLKKNITADSNLAMSPVAPFVSWLEWSWSAAELAAGTSAGKSGAINPYFFPPPSFWAEWASSRGGTLSFALWEAVGGRITSQVRHWQH
jgi:hypothetical protein